MSTAGIDLGFCSRLIVNLQAPGPITLFIPLTPTSGTCNGTVSIPLAIPIHTNLCKLRVCFQWVVACRTAGVAGHGGSDCLDFGISGI